MPARRITLKDWQDIRVLIENKYTYHQIAEMYGVTPQCINTGYSRKYKAYQKLRSIFG